MVQYGSGPIDYLIFVVEFAAVFGKSQFCLLMILPNKSNHPYAVTML